MGQRTSQSRAKSWRRFGVASTVDSATRGHCGHVDPGLPFSPEGKGSDMMRRPRTAADFAVLGVLAPGGLLTVEQLAQQARLTAWSVRSALLRLQSRGLIMDCRHRGRWTITQRGRGEWAAKGRRFTL